MIWIKSLIELSQFDQDSVTTEPANRNLNIIYSEPLYILKQFLHEKKSFVCNKKTCTFRYIHDDHDQVNAYHSLERECKENEEERAEEGLNERTDGSERRDQVNLVTKIPFP